SLSLRAKHGIMCGRYTLHLQKEKLAAAIAFALPDDYEPDYNIGPGRMALGITAHKRTQPIAVMLYWGLRTPQNFHINARLETADTTPRFRDSWQEHRCLLPANGFYEWFQDGITKQPYYIYPAGGDLHYFAGLWFPSGAPDSPSAFVLLTTQAQPALADIHERMPVILPQNAVEPWLDGELNKPGIERLAHEIRLEKHTISRRINCVQNKDSRLIEATSPLTDDQMMLF
ncbi:MAG: SOS response-associated peptidase, partial [Puniceicoccaceae bacterium]